MQAQDALFLPSLPGAKKLLRQCPCSWIIPPMKMQLIATIILVGLAAQVQADEAKLSSLTTSVCSPVISGSITTAATLQLLADSCAMRSPILPSRLTPASAPQNQSPVASNPVRFAPTDGTLRLGNPGSSLRYEDNRRVFPAGVGASIGAVGLSPSAVPEPTTFVLLSAGALALFAAKRRVS